MIKITVGFLDNLNLLLGQKKVSSPVDSSVPIKTPYKQKILIVEDEKPAATRLMNMLKKVEPDMHVIGITDGVESTLNFLDRNQNPDLIFMDIHLADGSAFEIFNHHPMRDMGIIFSTAFDQYAIEAFKVNALYYLLKPIKQEELEKALARFKEAKNRDHNYKEMVNKLTAKPPAYSDSAHSLGFEMKYL